jgi:DHA2 family multidrug resistance protein
MQMLQLKYGDGAAWTIVNQYVNQQAAMIAYIDDFKAMMWMTLAAVPLVLLIRRPAPGEAGTAAAAHLD